MGTLRFAHAHVTINSCGGARAAPIRFCDAWRIPLNFSLPFIARPIATILLVHRDVPGRRGRLRFLPVAALPNVEFPTIHVSASRPGADPSTMAATVAAPLERRLGEIPGVIELTSTSSLGTTSISIQFDIGRKIDSAARDVQAALNAAVADLPGDLPSLPSFRKANPNGVADPHPGADLGHAAGERDLRHRRYRHRPAPVPGRRRRRGQGAGRRAAGDAGARQPGGDRQYGHQHGGRAPRHRQRQCGRSARRVRRRRRRRDHRHQRPDARSGANTATSWSSPRTAR